MSLNNKVVKNASWIIVCSILQSLMSLVIGTISARYLGPSNYGLISYASSIVTFIVPVVQLGMRNTLVQELVLTPEKEGKILGTTLVSCIVASLFGIIGIFSFVSIANRGETDTIIVCALYSFTLIFQMSEMILYWFQAKMIAKYISLVSLFAYSIVSIYKIYLLITGKSIYWFAISNALDYLLISVILFIIYLKKGGQRLSYSFSLFLELFSRSKYYIVSGMMVTIFSQTDKIMLNLMIDETATGLYSAASTCAAMTSFVYLAIIDSFRPVIFEEMKKAKETIQKNMTRLYAIIIFIGLAQSLFLTFGANLVINILYGSEYDSATSILQIITWYSGFSYMGTVRNIWMLAEQKQKYLWIINLSGAVINVIGNFILIPVLGANGAAIASVVTQFFTNFVLCFIIRPIRPCGILILKSLNPKILIEMIPRKSKEN